MSPAKVVSTAATIAPGCRDRLQGQLPGRVLDLPPEHSEGGLAAGLVENLKQFLIELGRDFCYVGSHYPLQVGGRDFALDLLFFNRALNCLVAIELKSSSSSPNTLANSSSTWRHSTAT